MRQFFRYLYPIKGLSIMEPLITVVGATGTGKSKLAVDLASRFNGEIINGDAMQMYRGLPIITNQIPVEERNGIPHHLIDCIGLGEEPWRVGLFKNECLRLIRDIHSRGKLPILVGGTHYYTQAVLLKDQLVGEPSADQDVDVEAPDEMAALAAKWPILDAHPDAVLQKLREVDPVMADRWHPNETRKIRRSLEIYFQTGKRASEVYAEQKRLKQAVSDAKSRDDAQQLRFPTMIFWVHSDRNVLNSRLNNRVDAMMEQGLMTEAEQMFEHLRQKNKQDTTFDSTRGVWIAIGFKELAPYFEALYGGLSNEAELQKLKDSCIELIKIATRQYSASQIKWIRNKLWETLAEAGMAHRLFLLDSTDVENWEKCITEPSEHLVQSLLRDEPTPDPKSFSELASKTLGAKEAQLLKGPRPEAKCIRCDVCNKTMTDEAQWEIHINGQVHRRTLKHAAKKAEQLRKKQDNLEEGETTPPRTGEQGFFSVNPVASSASHSSMEIPKHRSTRK
ncbi:putative tRNA isopentenyltransferase [Aspergillus steynii IBT 23096]|uniref:tRNA dimethylallyltransferase n=1 Tax=Aspergillus steynii IBT 23096 TaxID=1392250 RepID=A0A2I2G9G5_9EURO|nr:putative tRNA isopentenyltransferase [Aspergillus steynii IBT 23096]PLB49520.1 putative tRNA isopentenyltransferase [Aspergillus steynii IBT 23096]